MADNESDEQGNHHDHVPPTVFVDREKSKVLYAEAGKDFVDALFSFITLPLGTIARLVAKDEDSNIKAVHFGSISSLYQSVSDLDQQYLWSRTCKEMLLMPRNWMGSYCRMMKLNIDGIGPIQSSFCCENKDCKIENRVCISSVGNQKCICGKLLNREIFFEQSELNGFVKETSTFIVSDDLYVMPNNVGTKLNILPKHGLNYLDAIDRQTVVDLLKLSLVSKTPMSDFIFKREHFFDNFEPRNRFEFWIGEEKEPSDEMVVKIVRRKSNEHILFLEAEENFADFILSFLTFPLGGVLHILQGFSFLSCIDNLYKSMIELSPDRYLLSEEVKYELTQPLCAAQFELNKQILPIGKHNYKDRSKEYKFVDPKSPISGGYAKGPLTFVVTDNLVVNPISSFNVVNYLERMNVPLNDLDKRVVKIGVKEGLSILKASLTTTSALTNGLSVSIIDQFLQEERSQSKRAKLATTETN
ncbi:hypothetical protein P8452_59972 [Trifolium repens]|nr:hypothetical protein P8452_59972 [Trifolium repens]